MLSSCNNDKPTATDTTTTTTTTTSSSSPATPPSGGGDPAIVRPERAASNPIQLIQNAQIKSELKLTDDQVTQVKQVETDLIARVSKEYDSIKTLPKEKQADEIEKKLAELTKESKGQMSKILKPEQEKRAKEIFLQIYDFGIITKDDFATELKLTDAQKKQLTDISGQMRGKMIAAWEIPDKDDAAKRDKTLADNRKRMEAVMKESNQQAKAVLKADQQKNLETLKGKAFPFTMPAPVK
jgi:Spy/CpxP family protein refolding chaperone